MTQQEQVRGLVKQQIVAVNGKPIKDSYPIITKSFIVFNDEPYIDNVWSSS